MESLPLEDEVEAVPISKLDLLGAGIVLLVIAMLLDNHFAIYEIPLSVGISAELRQ